MPPGKPGRMRIPLSLEQISQFVHLPITTAASQLGVCVALLKRKCRQLGLSRWPHRQVKALSTKLSLRDVHSDPKDVPAPLMKEIEGLRQFRESVFTNIPNTSIDNLVYRLIPTSDSIAQPIHAPDMVYMTPRYQTMEVKPVLLSNGMTTMMGFPTASRLVQQHPTAFSQVLPQQQGVQVPQLHQVSHMRGISMPPSTLQMSPTTSTQMPSYTLMQSRSLPSLHSSQMGMPISMSDVNIDFLLPRFNEFEGTIRSKPVPSPRR